MKKNCKTFYKLISESCDIVSMKDSAHSLTVETNSRNEVRKIHKLALVSGGHCDGEPKVRSFNGQFSAYLIDPAGNRVEVLCSRKKAI